MLNPVDTTEQARRFNSATYSAEDNKIRLYCGRVSRESYEYLRKLKFVSTPKQDCDFVATWSPSAEDAALALIPDGDDIQDEDYTFEDRAADRAERFSGYRDKRRAEAHGHADNYDSGDAAYGNQNLARAERAAARRDRQGKRACTQWAKAEYWQRRTEGVISHALYKSSAHVRRGRVLEIEKAIRRIEAAYEYDQNDIREWDGEKHVFVGKGRGGRWRTLESVQQMSERDERWLNHYRLRLAYENAMLEAEGGIVAAVEMEPGGFIGNRQIYKINKSPATGRVVSVQVVGEDWHGNRAMVTLNVERLGEDAYRAPTDEERAAFKAKQKAKPKAPSLINPTLEDAQRLQALWNSRSRSSDNKEPAQVMEMTQKEYTARTKRTDMIGTWHLTTEGRGVLYRGDVNKAKSEGRLVAKIRVWPNGFYGIPSVIVLTDKPQKPLPLDWTAIEQPAEELDAVSA